MERKTSKQRPSGKNNGKTIGIIVASVLLVAACVVFVINMMPKKVEKVEIPSPIVTMEIEDLGTITLELYPDIAPNTVANFVTLAQSGFYDGLTFHRVIPGFMIQGGDPDGVGTGGPGYSIKGEFTANGFENDLSHTTGVISMARSSAYDSAGSQFFIMHSDSTYLDGQYAAFGKVIDEKSMDVVNAIANTPTDANDKPLVERKILKVTVDTKGYDYTVEKIEDK